MINRDLMNNASADRVARATFALLSRLQDFPPHEQSMALAAAFVTVAEHHKMPAQDIFTATKAMLNDEANLAEFAGMKDYVKYEL